jgi:hypothetical protein
VLENVIAAGDGSGHVGTTRYEEYRRLHPDASSRATVIARHADSNTAQSAAADLAAAQRRSSSRRARRSTTSGQPAPRRARLDHLAGEQPLSQAPLRTADT